MDTDFVKNSSYPAHLTAHFQFDGRKMESCPGGIRPLPVQALWRPQAVSAWALSRTRRSVDCLVAALALMALLPLIALIAIAVRLGSNGPALFRQERMGRNGCVFTLYKFRSMRLETDHSSPITVTGDRRITRVGSILRRYKLDELPQFWNVLRGEMSLVGPRPKLPHHEALHMPFRPGITGAATLAFRSEEKMLSRIPREHLDTYYELFVKPSKARLDWEYMQSASLKSDLNILWQTARACLSGTEPSYRVDLPEFADAIHEFTLPEAAVSPEPSFSASAVV